MPKKPAPEIASTTIEALMGVFYREIGDLAEECEGSRANQEEKFSATERYQRLEEAAQALESIRDDNDTEDLQWDDPWVDKPAPFTPPVLRKSATKADRLAFAVAHGREAAERLEALMDNETVVTLASLRPDVLESLKDQADKFQEVLEKLGNQVGEAEAIEF